MSTKTVLKPKLKDANTLDFHVIAGTITSSLFFRFNALSAINKASVPLATDIQFLVEQNFANFFSNNLTALPLIKSFDFII